MLLTSPANIRYLTGFSGSSALVFVTARGEVLFVTDFRYKTQVADEVGDLARVIDRAAEPVDGALAGVAELRATSKSRGSSRRTCSIAIFSGCSTPGRGGNGGRWSTSSRGCASGRILTRSRRITDAASDGYACARAHAAGGAGRDDGARGRWSARAGAAR